MQDSIEQEHGGWENNEGALGTFEINVVARTIELKFNERFVGTNTFTHSF